MRSIDNRSDSLGIDSLADLRDQRPAPGMVSGLDLCRHGIRQHAGADPGEAHRAAVGHACVARRRPSRGGQSFSYAPVSSTPRWSTPSTGRAHRKTGRNTLTNPKLRVDQIAAETLAGIDADRHTVANGCHPIQAGTRAAGGALPSLDDRPRPRHRRLCYRVGPYPLMAGADKWRDDLRTMSDPARPRAEEPRKRPVNGVHGS